MRFFGRVGRRFGSLARGVLAAPIVLAVLAIACSVSPTSPLPAGIDGSALQQLDAEVAAGAFGDIQSLLIARGSAAPVERYYRGARRDAAVPIYSVTKSIVSLLAGIAIDERAIAGDSARLETLLPTRADRIRADALRMRLTLRDLLTMRAGIAWNEFSAPYGAPQHPLTLMFQSSDWVGHMLDLPMAVPPDSTYSYNTGVSIMLGAAIASATRRDLRDYAQERLFAPLGIPRPAWHTSSLGTVNSGSGLSLRPSDLVRIGRLVLTSGVHEGNRLVPAAWIARSTQPVSFTHGGTRYGYQWWLLGPDGPYSSAHPIIAAVGYGGQLLLIDPSLELVVVVTANAFDRDAVDLALRLVPRVMELCR